MATKSAIGKMRQDALDRMAGTMTELVERWDIAAFDIESVKFRDPEFTWAARLQALADWLDALNAKLTAAGIDLRGARDTSARLASIRDTLDVSLNSMTVKDLKDLADKLEIEFNSRIKQEWVNVIGAFLTGHPLETMVPADQDAPEQAQTDEAGAGTASGESMPDETAGASGR